MDSTHSTSESDSDDALDKLWKAKAQAKADLNSFADTSALAQSDAAAPAQSVADAAAPAQNDANRSRAANAKKAREALAKKRAAAPAQGVAAQQLPEYVWPDGEKKAAKTLLEGGGPVNMKLLEKVTGASKYFLLTLVPIAGQTILDLDQEAFMDLLKAVKWDVDSGSLRGVAFFFFRAHDETPAMAREIVTEAGTTRASKPRTAKVFAQRLKFRMVLAKQRCHFDVERDGWDYIHIHGNLASRLCSMQSQTGENLLQAIRTHGWLSDATLKIIETVFPLKGVVALTDSLPATLKAERAFGFASLCDACRSGSPCHTAAAPAQGAAAAPAQGPTPTAGCWKHGHIRCRIHRAHTSHKLTSDLASGVVTGLVNCTLHPRSPGVWDKMKKQAREQCKSVIIRHGRVPQDVLAWRKSIEKTFMRKDSPRTRQRRVAWDLLWNGDGRTNLMEHYCRGCCQNKEHTIQKMHTWGIEAVMGTPPPEYPRKSWKGADETLDAIGTTESMHHMFSQSLLSQAAGSSVPPPSEGAEDKEKRDSLYRATTARNFVKSPTFLADLVAQRRIASVFSDLKYSMLRETSADWELQQFCHEAHSAEQRAAAAHGDNSAAPPQGGAAGPPPDEADPEASGSSDVSSEVEDSRRAATSLLHRREASVRQYRAAVGFRTQCASRMHLAQISQMLGDRKVWDTDFAIPDVMSHRERASKHQDSFRMLSRAGACVQEHVSKLERRYPAKLTAMLEQPELLSKVLDDFAHSPRAFDSLSYEIVRRYFAHLRRSTAVPAQGAADAMAHIQPENEIRLFVACLAFQTMFSSLP